MNDTTDSGMPNSSFSLIGLAALLGVGILMWLAASSASSASLRELRLGCVSQDGMEDVRYLRRVIEPPLAKHGYRLTIVPMHPQLITDALVSGTELDGDCGRDEFYGRRFDNAVLKVGPAFRHAILTIWGRADKADLSIHDLTIGYSKGWQLYGPLLKRFGYRKYMTYESVRDLPMAARRGEIDAFLSYYAALHFIERDLHPVRIVNYHDVLAVDVFLYLRPQFKPLFADLAQAIVDSNLGQAYPDINAEKFAKKGDKHLVFGCSIPPKYPLFHVVELFYREAFSRLGYSFSMVPLPRAREVAELLSGRLDGSCGRADLKTFSGHQQLLHVPVAIARTTRQLVTSDASVQSLEAIADDKKIYYVRGTIVKSTDDGRLLPQTMVGVNTVEAGLKMLAAGRIEYFIDTSALLNASSDYLQLEESFYKVNLGGTYHLYPFLSQRHKPLLAPLERQIRQQLELWPNQYLLDF